MPLLCGLKRFMAVELVLYKEAGIEVINLEWNQLGTLSAMFLQLPVALQKDIDRLQLEACRWGKNLQADFLVQASDQIAYLPKVTVDPKITRRARVEKQRKAARTAKYLAAAAVNAANSAKNEKT
jgi:putative ubiquitin-RnfH superfamily antitoxin RatB of RatAB toxin-antitoxin module